MTRVALATMAMVFVVGCGGARTVPTPNVGQVRGEAVLLEVVSGREVLPIFTLKGRSYLLGTEGLSYVLEIENRTDERIEVVVSVDGRDVITGAEADFRKHRGYVLGGKEKIPVEGFRRTLDAVAAFEFSSIEESYASKMGDDGNVGVIGLAVFREQPRPVDETPVEIAQAKRREAPSAARSLSAQGEAAQEDRALGTKYGDTVDSTAEIVPFVRMNSTDPQEILVLYYDDRAGLEQVGVVFPEDGADGPSGDIGPDPFPGVSDQSRFAPPPPER